VLYTTLCAENGFTEFMHTVWV